MERSVGQLSGTSQVNFKMAQYLLFVAEEMKSKRNKEKLPTRDSSLQVDGEIGGEAIWGS